MEHPHNTNLIPNQVNLNNPTLRPMTQMINNPINGNMGNIPKMTSIPYLGNQ